MIEYVCRECMNHDGTECRKTCAEYYSMRIGQIMRKKKIDKNRSEYYRSVGAQVASHERYKKIRVRKNKSLT